MKRIISAFILTATLSMGATLTLEPSESSIGIGSTVIVEVKIDGMNDLFAFQFDLVFQPGVLAVENASDVSDGAFLDSGAFFPGFIDNAAGTVTFVADTLSGAGPGVNGSGVLARILLTGVAAGTSSVAVENPILLNSNLADINADFASARLTVTGDSGSPIPEPSTSALIGLGAVVVGLRARRLRAILS